MVPHPVELSFRFTFSTPVFDNHYKPGTHEDIKRNGTGPARASGLAIRSSHKNRPPGDGALTRSIDIRAQHDAISHGNGNAEIYLTAQGGGGFTDVREQQ